LAGYRSNGFRRSLIARTALRPLLRAADRWHLRTGPLFIPINPKIVMSKISTPRDLLVEELKDLYSAENQLVKALPKMAKAATSDELREAFEEHLEQTETHAQRLEQIGKQLGESMKGKKCKAMEGLVEEGKEVLEEDMESGIRDLALIGAAQRVEHYEIAGYGTARTLAEISGEDKVAKILQETLDEEGETDKKLTEIAMELNLETAATADEED
jgi:ferritin-like metal-binding protein YciE